MQAWIDTCKRAVLSELRGEAPQRDRAAPEGSDGAAPGSLNPADVQLVKLSRHAIVQRKALAVGFVRP
jgi:hypothetical protein